MSKVSLTVSKKTQEEVLARLTESMPEVVKYMRGNIEQAYVEGQDLVFLTVGRTGYGKSNFSALINVGILPIVKEVTGKKREFDFTKNAAWSGMDFLMLLKPICYDVARKLTGLNDKEILRSLMSIDVNSFFTQTLEKISDSGLEKKVSELETLEKKYGYTQMWLDEAQDLNSKEAQNIFNREMVKIMSGIRDMHLIYTFCIPSPFLLNNYIREERVNTMFFPFPLPQPSSKKRYPRKLAVYDLGRYYPILNFDSLYVRRLMINPVKFIGRFRPRLLGSEIPLFPEESKEWITYRVMKKLATVRLPLQSIEKIKEKVENAKKSGYRASKPREELLTLM